MQKEEIISAERIPVSQNNLRKDDFERQQQKCEIKKDFHVGSYVIYTCRGTGCRKLEPKGGERSLFSLFPDKLTVAHLESDAETA